MKEAKSNIEYLQIFEKPCAELNNAQSPTEIPEQIPHILHLFRFIWMNSPFYNAPEKIILLCRALSNQIILLCTDYIDLRVVFQRKHSRAAIAMFQTCIDCLTKYIKAYVLVADSHTEFSCKPWKLEKSSMFNHVDSFIQRCKDMIEVCEAMITFGRFDENEPIPKPKFGGNRGPEFESVCDKIESMFVECLEDVEKVSEMIFNVQNAEWFDEILKFRNRMKDIEIVVENLVNDVFSQIKTMDDGVEALAAFYNYSLRPTLKTLFDRKTIQVYKLFHQEIQDCKQDLVEEQTTYPMHFPYFAGRAMMSSMKKSRLQMLKQVRPSCMPTGV